MGMMRVVLTVIAFSSMVAMFVCYCCIDLATEHKKLKQLNSVFYSAGVIFFVCAIALSDS